MIKNTADLIKLTATNLEIYMFYTKIGKAEKKGDFNQFFANLNKLDEELANTFVFLQVDEAWQHSRFVDKKHAVLKAYVPQNAIEGRTNGLTLKKGIINKLHVHGCFPAWEKGQIYIENPFFAVD